MTREKLRRTMRETMRVNVVYRVFIDMAGGAAEAALLGQIYFWHQPPDVDEKSQDENAEPGQAAPPQTRLQVHRNGHYWLVKGYADWWKECGVTFASAKRIIPQLEERGLIVTEVHKFRGVPTLHIRIEWDGFLSAAEEAIFSPPADPSQKYRKGSEGGK